MKQGLRWFLVMAALAAFAWGFWSGDIFLFAALGICCVGIAAMTYTEDDRTGPEVHHDEED